jgi:Pre-PUA-like domain
MFKKEYQAPLVLTIVSLPPHFPLTVSISRSLTPGAKSKVKSSVQRAIRTKVVETYPQLAPYIDEIIPKKSQLDLLKLYCLPF